MILLAVEISLPQSPCFIAACSSAGYPEESEPSIEGL